MKVSYIGDSTIGFEGAIGDDFVVDYDVVELVGDVVVLPVVVNIDVVVVVGFEFEGSIRFGITSIGYVLSVVVLMRSVVVE